MGKVALLYTLGHGASIHMNIRRKNLVPDVQPFKVTPGYRRWLTWIDRWPIRLPITVVIHS